MGLVLCFSSSLEILNCQRSRDFCWYSCCPSGAFLGGLDCVSGAGVRRVMGFSRLDS